ncbi:MAG: hypothetical protein FWG85_00935 [Bacteroidetes bacterium]|nr:hypothetical protein [Bacteroidota bacterium]
MFNFNLRLVLIALAISLMFVACGGNKQQENAEATPENTGQETFVEENISDTKTVAGYIEQFGLTEDDIKPEGFVSFEGPDGWLIKINASEKQFDDWSKKVFNKIKTISTDGKVYQQGYPVLGKDEAEWSTGILMFQWAYPYNEKVVELEVLPGDIATVYRIALHFQ